MVKGLYNFAVWAIGICGELKGLKKILAKERHDAQLLRWLSRGLERGIQNLD